MILGGGAILERLREGQIFRQGTWTEKSIKEASYALRVANDGLMLEGKRYWPEKDYVQGDFEIKPGKIAILSTIEQLNMPDDLVGKLGIRFNYASRGLTGLMGIQVDPLFGTHHNKERLYIRVANLGNEPVPIARGAEVFTFEIHEVKGSVPASPSPKDPMWYRIQYVLSNQKDVSWSYVTRVEQELQTQANTLEKRLESARMEIREYLQPLVMFGIFLVAVTILSVALSVIVSVHDIPEGYVPAWMKNWGWILLLITLSMATTTTAVMGALTAWRLWRGPKV